MDPLVATERLCSVDIESVACHLRGQREVVPLVDHVHRGGVVIAVVVWPFAIELALLQ